MILQRTARPWFLKTRMGFKSLKNCVPQMRGANKAQDRSDKDKKSVCSWGEVLKLKTLEWSSTVVVASCCRTDVSHKLMNGITEEEDYLQVLKLHLNQQVYACSKFFNCFSLTSTWKRMFYGSQNGTFWKLVWENISQCHCCVFMWMAITQPFQPVCTQCTSFTRTCLVSCFWCVTGPV